MSNLGPLYRPTGYIDNLTESDWQEAEKYFSDNPNITKFDKYDAAEKLKNKASRQKRVACSFIRVNEQIFAIKNGECVGEGAFGKVKVVQNRAGENFAVKIEGRGRRGDTDAELTIMKALEQFHGEGERYYHKVFKGQYASKKLYTVMDLHEGNELLRELYVGKTRETPRKNLTEEQKLLLAIRSAQAIQYLHDHQVVHADIKPPNLMAKVDGEVIVVAAIDFGFSKLLRKDQEVLYSGCQGSPLYCAPEIIELNYDASGNPVSIKRRKEPAAYSFASDIFALGAMFKYDFDLNMGDQFYRKIMHTDPKQRHKMDELIGDLYQQLEKQPSLSNTAQKFLAERPAKPNKAVDSEVQQIPNALAKSSEENYRELVSILTPFVENIETDYQQKRQSTGWGQWLKGITSRKQSRTQQLSDIKEALKQFTQDPSNENIRYLNQVLADVQTQIKGEYHFLGASGLESMIADIQKKVRTSNQPAVGPSQPDEKPSRLKRS